MRLRAKQLLLVGIAAAALVAMGGRYSVHYLNRQVAKEQDVRTEFDACLKRFDATHPKSKGAVLTLEEVMGKTDAIGCQYDVAAAADVSAEEDQRYSVLAEYWSPRVAIAVLILLAAPWLWQFLLRRVAELGVAFRRS